MFVVSIILMVAGFIGVLAAANIRQQPAAVFCALVMLTGLGMYAWYTFNPPPNTDYKIYDKAVNQEIAGALKSAGVSKVCWLSSEQVTDGSYLKDRIDNFKEVFGGEVEIVAPEESTDGMIVEMDSKRFKEITSKYPDSVILIDMSLLDGGKMEFLKSSYKGPKVFFSANGSLMGPRKKAVVSAFEKGNILGMIIYKPTVDDKFEPSDSELKEAFNSRYILVTKDNLKENESMLPF